MGCIETHKNNSYSYFSHVKLPQLLHVSKYSLFICPILCKRISIQRHFRQACRLCKAGYILKTANFKSEKLQNIRTKHLKRSQSYYITQSELDNSFMIAHRVSDKIPHNIHIDIIGGSGGGGGGVPGAHHPLWHPILSFSHTFSPKSARIRGPCPH